MEPRDRLILALDVPTIADAEAMVTKLGDSVSFYKIGYQLAFAGGLSLAQELVRDKKQVFIDLKLHDIGNTAETRDRHGRDGRRRRAGRLMWSSEAKRRAM